MKILSLLFCSFILFASTSLSAQEYSFQSPDEKLSLEINCAEQIHFTLSFEDQKLIEDAHIAMETNLFQTNKSRKKPHVDQSSVQDEITPLIAEKSSRIRDDYNQMTLKFKGFGLQFRLYNNGFAYRFIGNTKGELIVKNEIAHYQINEQFDVYYPEDNSFISHYERYYPKMTLDSIQKESFCVLPVLFEKDNVKMAITETDVLDYPNMFLKFNEKEEFEALFPPAVKEATNKPGSDRNENVVNEDYIAKTSGKRNFPWRIFMVSADAAGLLSNQMPYLLAPKQALDNVGWIEPGKVAWDWWNANNIYGVDFKSGINTQTYKYYIDFAAKFNIPYVILDEGWSKTTDVLAVVPEIDMEELTVYAEEKNVGLILWVLWKPLLEQIDKALEQYELWNIKGIKVDFMQRADQQMVNIYEKIALKAALHQLIVDFHGAYKPSGLRRKYPNVLTYEGVKGLENVKWSRDMTPTHNTTLPFTRMLAGPMDYTPGAMRNAQPKNFAINWTRPMSMGTRAHQAAMYVIYESPLQMLCDNPSNYLKEPDYTRFIADIPVCWDETFVPAADIGKYIVMARKKDNKYYLGALNNEDGRTLSIECSFLDDGVYKVHILKDGINAATMAEDYRFEIKDKIKKGDTLNIKLAPGGGYVAVFTKIM